MLSVIEDKHNIKFKYVGDHCYFSLARDVHHTIDLPVTRFPSSGQKVELVVGKTHAPAEKPATVYGGYYSGYGVNKNSQIADSSKVVSDWTTCDWCSEWVDTADMVTGVGGFPEANLCKSCVEQNQDWLGETVNVN